MIPQAGKAVFLAAISALLQSRKLSMHTASNPMQTESRAHEELRLLYQVSTSDISYFKTQQWSVTNYTLLVLAALVAAAQILKPSPSCTDRCLLTVLAGVAAIGAAGLLFNLELSIRKRRDRLQKSALNSALHSTKPGVPRATT